MLEYAQSVIASTPGPYPPPDESKEEVWDALRRDVAELYDKLTPWFQICRSAYLAANQAGYDDQREDLYVQAEMLWLAVRGDCYDVHVIPHLKDFLTPHSEVLKDSFGVSAAELLDGIERIQKSLTFGLARVVGEMEDLVHEIVARSGNPDSLSWQDRVELIGEQSEWSNDWRNRRDSIMGRFLGLDLFDVQKVTGFPVVLLEQLSWGPGDEREFFSPGSYCGWPLRLLPIMIRPFLKVREKYYCFHLGDLHDHLYRVIQRTLARLKPEYKEQWNKRQKIVSEAVPLALLQRLLPGAVVHQNIWYRAPTGTAGKMDWCELDGLLTYDDRLIVVEVKAGAFAHAPPTTDFDAHITSVEELILKPAQQATRFVQALELAGRVDIYDRHHKRTCTIERNTFRHVTRCCVTLDNLTELAATTGKLGEIGVVIPEGAWCVSLSDLRVYADILVPSGVFTHFLEQRLKAAAEKTVELLDELDHLGLYLQHNLYVDFIKGFVKDTAADSVNWFGYRDKIDEYYHALLTEPEKAKPPCQRDFDGFFAQTIRLLSSSDMAGRCRAASYLLDMGSRGRASFNSMIARAIEREHKRGAIIPVSWFGGTRGTTAFCYLPTLPRPSRGWMRDYVLKRLLIGELDECLLLVIDVDSHDSLCDVDFEFLSESDIQPNQRQRLEAEAKEMQDRMVNQSLDKNGRIGRNELCPCGSGRKYKRCCGRPNRTEEP